MLGRQQRADLTGNPVGVGFVVVATSEGDER
jgi:hypothetical protein